MDLSIFARGEEDALYDVLRSERPVHFNPESEHGPAFWALTRYDDVQAAAADNERLSSAHGTQIVDRRVEGKGHSSLHNSDDPLHAKLRRIAVPHLRAVKIKQWQDVIDSTVSRLLDQAQERGTFDLVELVSARLPMLVLAQVLGVPEQDAPKMVDWTNRLTSSDPDHVVDEVALAEAREEVLAYFAHLTELRRAEPTNDLVSVLANGEIDGTPLSWEQLAAYYIVLVAAGNETTRHLVSGATVAFHDNRDQWERLVAEPGFLAPAVEEMFRYVSPVAAMRRTALVDLTIRDTVIRAGEKVVLWFAAANRDPEAFAEPHRFQIDRSPNEHLTFGWGIHFCLGAHLARAEVRAFWSQVLQRGLSFELIGEPERVRHNLFRGWASVPVAVRAASS